jgi:chromosome segregation ATPase
MSEYLTAAEAAKRLGCSETLIRNRLTAGTLAGEKVLGRWHILREDVEDQAKPHASSQPNRATEPHNETALPQPVTTEPHNETAPHEWRDDLLAQAARLEADVAQRDADKDAMRADFDTRLAEQRQESGLVVEASKARVIDLERELTVRGSRVADLEALRESDVTDMRGQIAVLEAKVREVLEKSQDEAMQLANRNADLADRIAGLVASHEDMRARVVELQPVAEQVPMLQAAVEEKDASLSERERELGNMRQDIETIASRPVTGPVFRLLTKGKLRR